MATEKYVWSVVVTKEFIKEIEKYPVLYDLNHEHYKNKLLKEEIMKKIAEVMNKVQEGCSWELVKKKIKGLRTTYLAEKIKINNSLKNVPDGGAVYVPSVYWYPMVKFFDKTSSEDMTAVANIRIPSTPVLNEHSYNNMTSGPSTSRKRQATEDPEQDMGLEGAAEISSPRHPTGKKQMMKLDTLLTQTHLMLEGLCETLTQDAAKEDECYYFAKYLEGELRERRGRSNDLYIATKRAIEKAMAEVWQSFLDVNEE